MGDAHPLVGWGCKNFIIASKRTCLLVKCVYIGELQKRENLINRRRSLKIKLLGLKLKQILKSTILMMKRRKRTKNY